MILRKIPHPEVPREARPRRTHDILPAPRHSCPASQRIPPFRKLGHTPGMPDYRRDRVPGGTFFFTVNLLDRRSDLLVTQIDILRDAVRRVRARTPFRIDAWVVLPDHMHCLADLAARRCRLPRSVARNQNRICEVFAYRRVTITGDDQPRRTGHLAASVLGAHDTRRSGLCGSHGLHAFQPGETRSRRAPGGLAAFVVSSVRKRRAVSRRLARRQ